MLLNYCGIKLSLNFRIVVALSDIGCSVEVIRHITDPFPGLQVYGCARPPGPESAAPPSDPDSDSDSDSALREVLLAPDDSEAPLVRPKHDQMGLGYRGLERRSVLGPTATDATLRYRDKAGKLAISGQVLISYSFV